MNNNEKWIIGYENKYSVTTDGKVYSYTKNIRKQLSSNSKTHRYLSVILSSNGIRKRYYIHKLILETFVCKRPENMVACHYNDNPLDNRLENLRWDTRCGNIKDAKRNGAKFGKTKHKYPYNKICDICNKNFNVYNYAGIRQTNQCSKECVKIKKSRNAYKAIMSNKGRKLTEEQKMKQRGRVFTEEHKRKIALGHSGIKSYKAKFIKICNEMTNEVKSGQVTRLCRQLNIDYKSLKKNGKTKNWKLLCEAKVKDIENFKLYFPEHLPEVMQCLNKYKNEDKQ